MPRNDAAAPGRVCPGIRIQAIDIVQPPGIGIPPIADMDAHQTIVTAALAAKSSAETPRNTTSSAFLVLVVGAPPDARLLAPLGSAVEPLVHAPEAVQSARVGGIGVVDDTVLEHECTHARSLACVCGYVGSGHGRDLGHGALVAAQLQRRAAPVVVFEATLALLLFGQLDVEIDVAVT